jgi:YD repeat-containing protein
VSYSYGQNASHYNASVLDPGPRAFYPLNDAAGATTAEDQVAANLGQEDGSYTSVTLGGAGPVAGSPATSASFNGTSSYVTLAPNLAVDSTYLSVGLWFKVASGKSGVLFAYQGQPMSASSSTQHTPALYVGTDGKLRGEFWNDHQGPITTTGTVTDGKWHYAVLSGAGNTQTLYLDGAVVNTMSGTIDPLTQPVDVVGAGFWNNWASASSNAKGFFTGSIADVAVYPRALTAGDVAEQYQLAQAASPELTQVMLPTPDSADPAPVQAQVTYDTSADRVSSYTDANGGQWNLSDPSTTGLKATSESLGQAISSVTLSDPAGHNEVYSYDDLNGGQLTSFDRGAGTGARLYTHDASGFLASVTDEDGNSVSFTNDVFGNVLSRSWSDVTGCPPTGVCTTYYSYYENLSNPVDPRNGALTGVRDARSSGPTDNTYLTSYAYNPAGELSSSTTPPVAGYSAGLTTSYAYTTAGGTPAQGGGTVPAGMLLSATTPGGAVTSYFYYSDGDLALVKSPSGLRTAYSYDGQGRAMTQTVTSDTFPNGLVTSYTWNAVNQPVTITHPAVANPVTGVTHQLVDTWSYDGDAMPVSRIQSDAVGGDPSRTWTWTYDDHERLAAVDDPAGGTTAYNYDGSGNVITMINADGIEHDYTYNAWNEVTSDTMQTPSGPQALSSYAYDPAGLLAAVTDPMGRITNYAYDPGQELIGVTTTDPTTNTGRDTLYTYDNAGNVASMSVNGLVGGLIKATSLTTYSTDAAGRTSQVVLDPQGLNRSTTYTYTPDSQVATRTVADGAGSTVTSYGYDATGDLTSQSVADGSAGNPTTTWTYDERGLPLTMVSPDGNVSGGTPANYTTSYSYDQAGNLAMVTEPPTTVRTYSAQPPVVTQPVTLFGHDAYGDLTRTMNPDGNVTSAAYDGDGRVTSVSQPAYTQPGGTSQIAGTTSYTYDGKGNLTSLTDPAGNITSYSYDQLGDLITRTDPQVTGQSSPGVWSYTYDADRELLSSTDPTGSVTTNTWDYFGDRATSTQQVRTPNGTVNDTTGYSYDYLGDPVQVTSPDGVKVTATYDPAGELTGRADAYGNTTSYEYNRLGAITQVTNPDQTSSQFAYDPAGRLTGTSQWSAPPPPPQAATRLAYQSYGYDANGNMTSQTNSDIHTTTWAYNPAGQVTSQVTPVSANSSITTSYGYDPAGNQTAYTDGNGNTTWTTYNSRGLPESVIEPPTTAYPNPADGTWTTSYNADGNPVTQTEPGGVTVTSIYDQLGRLTGQSGAGADAPTATRTFGYDLAGRLNSAGTPAGTDTFGYDDAGNLLSAAGPSGASSFTWNGDNQATSAATPAGTTSYTYDNAGRLATLTNPAPAATLTYGYNQESQVSSISYGSGNDTRTFGYDGLHRLTSDTLATPGGQTVASQDYSYDPNGNMMSKTTTGLTGAGSTTFGYDWANRLTSVTSGGTTTNYGWDNAGYLSLVGSLALNYDARDELNSTQLG